VPEPGSSDNSKKRLAGVAVGADTAGGARTGSEMIKSGLLLEDRDVVNAG
jgi:hypothetical protein